MGEWIRCGLIALLRYCVCQCAAALPVLVDFLLSAADEDYCDSPSLLISLCLTVFLTISIHWNHLSQD